MRIEVLYFAAVRELRKRDGEVLTVPAHVADVASLAAHLEATYPALSGHLGRVRFAIDEELVDGSHPLREGAVVAIIPPVAGGSDARPARERVALRREPLSIDAVCALVRHPGAGALAVFVGVVRDHAEGRAVSALEYSAYESMAVAEMVRVVEAIEGELAGVRLAVHHRIGALAVGDDAVVCVASAAHRDAAFTAGRALIDRIKERVPIWKRETHPEGSRWVGWDDA